jgi:hypothetical protein
MTPAIRQTLSEIAARELDIPTLEARGRDSLDFHEVSVWSLAEALVKAYKAGQSSTPRGRRIRSLIDRADDLIAAIEGTTDQFEPEVARLQAAVTKAEQVRKGGEA